MVQRRFERAESLYEQGQLTEAYRLYEQLWEDYEPHRYSVPARMRMAELDLAQKHPEQAEDALKDVLAASPTADVAQRAQLLYGDVLYARGEWAGAREHYQAYLASNPKAPEAVAILSRIGEIHERRGEYGLALRAYDRALELATKAEDVSNVQRAVNAVLVGEISTEQLEEVAGLYAGRAIGVAAARVAEDRRRNPPRIAIAPVAVVPPPAAPTSAPTPTLSSPQPTARESLATAALPPLEPPPTSSPLDATATTDALASSPPAAPEDAPPATQTAQAAQSATATSAAPMAAEATPVAPELTVSPDLATTIALEADVVALQRARQRSQSAATIVCLLPLSGKYAPFGLRALDGITEAADVFRPGANGDPVVPVRFLIGDTQGDPDHALALFDELVEPNHAIAVVGPMVGKVAEVISQRTAALGIPLITLARTAQLAGAGQWSFRASLTDADLTHNLAKVAVEDMGIRRFAVLFPNEPYGMEIRDRFVQDVRAAGGEIRAVAGFSPNASDFSAPIKTLLARRKPGAPDGSTPDDLGFDALFVPGSESNVKLLAPQLVFQDVTGIQLLGTNSWNSTKLIADVGSSIQGAFFLDGFFPASPNPEVRTFVQRFNLDFDREATLIEALAYEAAYLIRERVESGAVRTRDELARDLATMTDYRGVAGLARFDANGDAVRKLKALTVADDEIVQVRWPVDRPGTTIRDIPSATAPR
ncbi:MAG: penicillin-binding protein activator [bacterium]